MMFRNDLALGCQYTGCTCPTTVENKSYCEDHVWLVYQKGTATPRRKDAVRAQAVWDIEALMQEAIEQLIEEGELE
jgi:hypothetical protein